MTTTTDTLAGLASAAEDHAQALTSLAERAAHAPYGAQATAALLQAATAAQVAMAYLDTARREAEAQHHHGPPCEVCGRRCAFDPAEGEPAVCLVCQGLAEPTGLSLADTMRAQAHLEALGPAHAHAMAQAWRDAFPTLLGQKAGQ